jgi:ribonuclease-3
MTPDKEREALLEGGACEDGLGGLEVILGHKFENRELLLQALSHRSFANEQQEEMLDNEVLEFLGDAVLGLVVSEMLYRRYPGLTEGQMSKFKAFLVSAGMLARKADEIDLGSYLLLGKGEEKTAGREKDSLLANTFEAVTAALYLDGGMPVAAAFLDRVLSPQLSAAIEQEPELQDFKSLLQEELQAVGQPLPVYQVVSENGPDHEKVFVVELCVGEERLAEGEGKTKKAAEQAAAEVALAELHG